MYLLLCVGTEPGRGTYAAFHIFVSCDGLVGFLPLRPNIFNTASYLFFFACSWLFIFLLSVSTLPFFDVT